MFNSLRNWFSRTEDKETDRRALEEEGKQFKLPSEFLPQVFKYAFFIGLGFLNYRLFAHAVPGSWGTATGVLAMMAEALALYGTHYFSRSAGAFRAALGLSALVLMAFSIAHATFSILDLIRVASMTPTIRWYSHVVAFPLLAALIGIAVVAITMTHPNNIVRLKQALGHTQIATGRAEAASRLALIRAERAVRDAELDHLKEQSRHKAELLGEVQKIINLTQAEQAMVAQIADPELREKVAREFGIDLPRHQIQWPQDQPTHSDRLVNRLD